MEKLKIRANGALHGEIVISGAKNAALPLLCASLLTRDTLHLANVPMLRDVKTTKNCYRAWEHVYLQIIFRNLK